MDSVQIKGREVYGIRPIAHLQNKEYDVAEGHPFHGQKYNTYQYDGKPFTVNSNDEFVKWRDAGILYSVTFKESTYMKEVDGQMVQLPSYTFIGCTNKNQELSMADTERLLNRIHRDVETTEVDSDVFNAITA